ncbi:MAG: DUF5668 domain-containing protein [Desulfitobacterium hafniense]|nr:DUF5668 domain-containing protein [Desulfitobacterium hafniense]
MKNYLSSICRGLVLITLGGIFLLINFGALSWGVWLNVIDLWPLILILAGVALFFNRRIPFSAVVLVFLLVLLGFSLTFGDRHWSNLRGFSESKVAGGAVPIEVQLPNGVKRADIDLNLGGSRVELKALPENEGGQYLAKGSYEWEGLLSSEPPKFSSRITGDNARLTLDSQKHLSPGGRNNLNVSLSDKVNYSFNINSGAINGDLDFSSMRLDRLDLNTGASKFSLRFGDNGLTSRVKINCAASDLVLVVPENVGLRVHFSGVVSNTNFMGSGLIFDNKDWASPNYNQAKTKIDLDISTAAGSVRLERPQSVTH